MNFVDKLKEFWNKNPFFFQVVPGVLLILAVIFERFGRVVAAFAFIFTLIHIAQSKEVTDEFDRRTKDIVGSILKK